MLDLLTLGLLAGAVTLCLIWAVLVDWVRSRDERRQARVFREVLIPDDVMDDIRAIQRGRLRQMGRNAEPSHGGD